MGGRNIFVDVGGAYGQTIEEISGPLWKFDLIFSFEPQKTFADNLKKKYGSVATIIPAALSDSTGQCNLYGDGGSASIFSRKRNVDIAKVQVIETISANEFFQDNIGTEDFVLIKLNCEGAEGRILTDLAAGRQLDKVANVMIDFDLRKVRGARRQPRKIMNMLAEQGFDRYFLSDDVMLGKSHAERIRNWLAHIPELERFCTDSMKIVAERKSPPLRRRIRRFFRYL